jgi:hypothetical protein
MTKCGTCNTAKKKTDFIIKLEKKPNVGGDKISEPCTSINMLFGSVP